MEFFAQGLPIESVVDGNTIRQKIIEPLSASASLCRRVGGLLRFVIGKLLAFFALPSRDYWRSTCRTAGNVPAISDNYRPCGPSCQKDTRYAKSEKAALLTALGMARLRLFADDSISLCRHLCAKGILLCDTRPGVLKSLSYIFSRQRRPLSKNPPQPIAKPMPVKNRSQFLLSRRHRACVTPSIIIAAISKEAMRRSRT